MLELGIRNQKDMNKKEIEAGYYKRYYISEKGQRRLLRNRCSVLKNKILEKLGKKCVKCGFSDWRALQIDHISGGGKKEIKSFKNNHRSYYNSVLKDTTGKYQILCANCNWIKRYENKECKNDLTIKSERVS